MQDGPHHGHREKALQVAVAVPVHHRHRVPLLYAQRLQRVGQALHPPVQFDIGVRHLVPVNDLPVREIGQRGRQDVFDQQGIFIRRRGFGDQLDGHGVPPFKGECISGD
jgi:hypothetical protein